MPCGVWWRCPAIHTDFAPISIGVNHLHIAGHARSEGLVLLTDNLSEFERILALEMENWVGRSQ